MRTRVDEIKAMLRDLEAFDVAQVLSVEKRRGFSTSEMDLLVKILRSHHKNLASVMKKMFDMIEDLEPKSGMGDIS